LAYIKQACEDGSSPILVILFRPPLRPGQQQIAEAVQLRRLDRPYDPATL
jgi:hypothetical protein